MADNVVLLRVQLDEGKTEAQLQKLVLDIEATRKAQTALTAARKADTITADEFAKQTVALSGQLKGQRGEYSALQKNLDLYRTATGDLANTYKGTQAQLSLAQRQYQQLENSQDNTTESTQALSKVIEELRTGLTKTDETQKLFIRNVGNYPKGENLEGLVRQLVELQEQTKNLAAGTDEAARAQMRIVGFQTQAAQAGAKEGKTFEETTDFIKQYGEAIRPATADLIKLTEQQQQLAETGEAAGEEVQQIGFKIGQAQKSIKDAAKALADVPASVEPATAGVKGFGDTITELDSTTGAFGGQVANLKQQFAQAKQGIDLAKGGFTGLKGAIASTGIGVLILALGALYEYFTKTDEGAEDLAAGLAFLKGLFSVLEGVAISAGKGLVKVFTDPKQAASDLLDFLEGQVVNRVKAAGKIFDSLTSGDFKGAAEGLVDYTTGIENTTGKAKAFAVEAGRAAAAASSIARAQNDLEDAERESLVTLEKNKNLIDQLVLTAKDRTLSEQQRLANLDKAGKLEKENLQTTLNLSRQRFDIAVQENAEAERSGKTSDELRDKVAQAQADFTRLAGQSASLQQSIQNRRSVLLQSEAADEKAAAQKALQAAEKAAEARLQVRRDALALEAVLLTRQLAQVQTNSDQELSLLQQKLRNGYQAELNVKNLTVAAKKVIDAKYESESLALALDFNRRRLQAALAAQADITAAELAGQQAGSPEALRLQAEQIEQRRLQALTGLQANADNTAAIAKINATAEQQQRQLEYQQATQDLNRYLDDKRNAIELDYAKGLIQEGEYQRRLADVAKAGTDAQAVVNKDYRQSNEENQKQVTQNEIEAARKHTADVKQQEETKQQVRETTVQAAQQATDAVIAAFGEESAAGQAALAYKKILAIAEIEIGLEKQFAANAETGAKISAIAPPVTTPLGLAYTIATDALAVAAAAASVANILKFEQGGIAYGPSHAQGGIPLYHRGRPAGIEIEGGEPVLHRGVSQNPLLLSLASTVNQLAGGRALVANMSRPQLALGGVAQPLVLNQLRGSEPQASAAAIGQAVADSLRKSPPITRISDVKAGLDRDAQTQKLSNS